jgi:hypothetical protein
MPPCRTPPVPYDWEAELQKRLDYYMTDEETADRLAEIDRLTAPLRRRSAWHRYRNGPWAGCWMQRSGAWILRKIEPDYLGPTEASYRERPWQAMLGLIGSGVLALLTVLAFVVL